MNIGFFTDQYVPQISGVVTSIEIFRKELEAMGHNVYIFAPRVPGYKETNKNVFRFRSTVYPFQKEQRFAFPWSVRNFYRLPELKLDIIHSHTEFGIGLLADFVSNLGKRPMVHTYHTLYSEYMHYLGKGKILSPKGAEKLSALYCNRADLNLVPSPRIKDLLFKYGVKTRIEILETGIDFDNFKKTDLDYRQKLRLPKGAEVLLFVGRLGKEKSVDFLIRSFALLKRPNAYLVIIGDGAERKRLEALAKSFKQPNVIFTGYQTREEVIAANLACDIFVFSSVTETQALVLLEAAAAKKPFVAVKDATVERIVKDGVNGLIVRPKEQEFAQALTKLLNDPKLQKKMGLESYKVALNFSARAQTIRLLELYKQVMY